MSFARRQISQHVRFFQGHARYGRVRRRSARAGRQRQQLEPALDRALRSAYQPVDHVDANADAPELSGRRSAVLFQHGRQADDGRGGRHRGWNCARRNNARRPMWRRRRDRLGHGLRHPLAVQVDRHVRMIAVVDI